MNFRIDKGPNQWRFLTSRWSLSFPLYFHGNVTEAWVGQRCVQRVAEYWQGWNLIFRFHCEELISPKGLCALWCLSCFVAVRYYRQATNCERYRKACAHDDAYWRNILKRIPMFSLLSSFTPGIFYNLEKILCCKVYDTGVQITLLFVRNLFYHCHFEFTDWYALKLYKNNLTLS